MAGFAEDYIQVNERIVAFRERFPDGSLQSEIVRLDDSIVVMKAFAFRQPDDPRPGVGHSSLAIPGSTPYTRGSELENCETSAFGRALAALGFEVKRGIASAEEVRNKAPQPARQPDARHRLASVAIEHHIDAAALSRYADQVGIAKGVHGTEQQIEQIIALIESRGELDGMGNPDPATQTGGEVLPAKPDYVQRAEARAAAAKPKNAREPVEPTVIGMGLDA